MEYMNILREHDLVEGYERASLKVKNIYRRLRN